MKKVTDEQVKQNLEALSEIGRDLFMRLLFLFGKTAFERGRKESIILIEILSKCKKDTREKIYAIEHKDNPKTRKKDVIEATRVLWNSVKYMGTSAFVANALRAYKEVATKVAKREST